VRSAALKQLERQRSQLAPLQRERDELAYAAEAGDESALAAAAKVDDKIRTLEREIARLEGVVKGADAAEEKMNRARHKAIVDEILTQVRQREDKAQFDKEQAGFAWAVFQEKANAALVSTSLWLSILDDARALTGHDQKYFRSWVAELASISRSAEAETLRSSAARTIRTARQGMALDWKPLVEEARALTQKQGSTR